MKTYIFESAPMEGVTTWQFRRIQAKHFGAVDRYYTPFLSPTENHRFTNREMAEILPDHNENLVVVPQLLTHSPEDFLWAANELKKMGYTEVNFNLGCPSGTVTKKYKGSGMLSDLKRLDRFFSEIFDRTPIPVSLKTRIGWKDTSEIDQLIELFNRYPFVRIAVHPRTAYQLYQGEPDLDAFEVIARNVKKDLVYNGDVFHASKGREILKSYSGINGIMCGRGLISNPKLVSELTGAKPLSKTEFWNFYDEFFDAVLERIRKEKPFLLHIKEYWKYWNGIFDADPKAKKEIMKCSSVIELRAATSVIRRNSSIREDAGFDMV